LESDAQLVVRAHGDDPQAFAELVKRHRGHVFSIAASILGPAFIPEAEDVAQEVFLKVHRSLRSFRGEAEFKSWLFRITFNEAVNVRSRVRYRRPSCDESALQLALAAGPGPDQEAESAQRKRDLDECIQRLPEVYQSALRLYYWLGKGVAEVGELLGIPENTAKSYLHRARLLLHGMLKERGYSNV